MNQRWSIFRHFFIANAKEYLRDPLTTLFAFILPLFFIFTFGLTAKIINSNQQSFILHVSVVGDEPETEALWLRLHNAPGLVVERQQRGDPAQLVRDNTIQAVVSWDNQQQKPVITTTSAFGSVAGLVTQALNHHGEIDENAVNHLLVAGDRFNYFTFIFPSIITMALLQVALFGTATPIVAARERGIYRYYAVIPLSRVILLASQVSVRLLISALQVGLLMLIAGLLFGLSIAQPWLFGALLLLGALVLVSFGYALAGLFRTNAVATMALTLLNFWCMIFGQLFLDLNSFPMLKWLVITTPVGFVSDAIRYAMNGTEGIFPFAINFVGMLIWGAVTLFIGIRLFRFQPKQS